MKTKIDATDVRIVEELRKNARITMKELGARVFLTGQAVRNRVERLEDMGILQRYTINVNCPVFGYKVHAVIRVQLRHGPVEALKACKYPGTDRTVADVTADKVLSMLGGLASPLSLLIIGAGFRWQAALENRRTTLLAALVKLVLLPAAALPPAAALGFRGEALVALLVMSGTPSAVSSYIMAENMGNDGVLANGIVAVTTLLSAVTLTGWIFLLRTLQLI